MNKKMCFIAIVFLVILSILGIYNFSHPIKKIEEKNIVKQGKILGVTEEYDYNENSEYVKKNYIELLVNNSEEHVSIEINKDELKNYQVGKKVNFYEEKGEYYITNSKKTPTNGGIIWIILSVIEILVAIMIFIKLLKK